MTALYIFFFILGLLSGWMVLAIVRRSNANARIWKQAQRKSRPGGETLT